MKTKMINYVVEKKVSRNPIPYEYGFLTEEEAIKCKEEIERNATYLLKWVSIEKRNFYKWRKN